MLGYMAEKNDIHIVRMHNFLLFSGNMQTNKQIDTLFNNLLECSVLFII